jgi:hypothetical protein
MTRQRTLLRSLCFAAIAVLAVPLAEPAHAICSQQGLELLKNLKGSWRGRGAVTPLGGGMAERVNCRVSYTTSGPSHINQVVACYGSDYNIEASSSVTCVGNRLEGSFQEKIAHNSGRVTGDISGDRLNIKLDGPSFKGNFNVVFEGEGKHTVSITQYDPAKGRQVAIASMLLTR